jgi:hypothetical protein
VASRIAVCVAAALATASCGSPQPACVIPPAAPSFELPFLWRVQRGDGPVVWLYGTVHNGGAEDVPLAAWNALDGATAFASELGDVEPDPDIVSQLVRLPPGKGLDQMLPEDEWWDLRDALRGVLEEDDLRHVRPWVAMTRLASKTTVKKTEMDIALAKHARKRGVPVDALETWEDQLHALDAAVKLSDLIQAIHTRAAARCALDKVLATYRSGDLPAMHQLLVVGQPDILLAARNRKWLPQLEKYLATTGAFVAVGLGHMTGDGGLLALLQRAGYSVERTIPTLPVLTRPAPDTAVPTRSP